MVFHVKYPSMERQDLSQSQLGAFKFTPVDEEPRSSFQMHQYPLLMDQYHQSLQKAGFASRVIPPDVMTDSSFFNNQIRPILNPSRSRFNTGAVHAPVSNTSAKYLERKQHELGDLKHSDTYPFRPHLHGSSDNESLPSMYTDYLSSHGALTSDSTGRSLSNASNSLLRALENEQEAHERTKCSLENEITARQDAEAETQRFGEQNKSLLNSIKLLKSTVKHMVHQQDVHNTVGLNQNINNVVNKLEQEAQQKNVANSNLHDATASSNIAQQTEFRPEDVFPVINLDLLTKPDAEDHYEQAELQRNSRRQTSLLPETELKKTLNAEYRQKIEQIVKGGQKGVIETKPLSLSVISQASTQLNSNGVDPQRSPRSLKYPLETSTTPLAALFDLPASFLTKYGKKSTKPENDPCKSPSTASLNIEHHKPSGVRVEHSSQGYEHRVGKILMPDTIALKWKVDRNCVDELRNDLVLPTKSKSYFQEHPIRYVPKLSDGNLYRTVMIDFIPFGTTYSVLLAEIRGGTIESIQLYGPIGTATDFVTARIVFTHETAAVGLYRRGQFPGVRVAGEPVRVWQVVEPTYPKNKELEEDIYSNGHTRILIANAPIDDIDVVLKRKLRPQIEQNLILDIGRSYDGVPIVEFTSIEEATKALRMLLKDREFAGSDFDFDDDYCAVKYA